MTRTDIESLGEVDTFLIHSPRAFLGRTWEPSLFEENSTNFYSLINPDDHD